MIDAAQPSLPKQIAAHAWEREVDEHYVEPRWCSERLFAEEQFEGGVWDPCCGFGHIPDSAAAAGLVSFATDATDRGYAGFAGTCDFLTEWRGRHTNIVCNPPFASAEQFSRRALLCAEAKVAMIFPTARLNAARWLLETPLARVWLMTPRPSMPPGHVIARGDKPGGGKMDFCWLLWKRGHVGPADLRWLHRNPPAA